jgi:hypothetical protein
MVKKKQKKPRKLNPNREDLRTKTAKNNFLEALSKSMSIITTACKMTGTARSIFYKWLETDEAFEAAVKEITEDRKDFAESKLNELINGIKVERLGEVYKRPPCKTSIIFFLKTKAKDRGYIERREFTGMDGTPLNSTQNEVAAMSDQELDEEIKKQNLTLEE